MHRNVKYIVPNWSKALTFNCRTLKEKVEDKKSGVYANYHNNFHNLKSLTHLIKHLLTCIS